MQSYFNIFVCSFRRLKRRSKTKNFLSISFSASRRRGGGRRREENARKFFGFCTRESASVSEAHCFVFPCNPERTRQFQATTRAARAKGGRAKVNTSPRPYRLTVRTRAFQALNRGSIPRGVTKRNFLGREGKCAARHRRAAECGGEFVLLFSGKI